jgi:NAD dependent epimerase/dehydratase family enzyme
MPAPAFMIRLVLGEFGSVILKGQRVIPKRLVEGGFSFRHPQLEEALRNLLT